MSWWTIIIRLLVTAAMGWATFKLLRGEVTVPKYTAAMPGLFLIALLWIADLEHSARIVAGFFEIDRRLELAEDARSRLEKLEQSATETARKLDAVVTTAQGVEKNLSDLAEKESLRRWAMILPSGRLALNPAGELSTFGSSLEAVYQNIFKAADGGWKWQCDDETLAQLAVLTEHEPQVPYAAAARASCLKQRSDASWRTEAEHAKNMLEKLKAIEPHVVAIDQFYEILR